MARNYFNETLQWLNPTKQNKNPISAAFHMIIITLISMSMAELNWFNISGDVCTPFITLSQFFWFGYTIQDVENTEYECITSTITNLMRIIILLCFMAIMFSLVGFFLEIIGPKSNVYCFIRRYSVPSTCTVLWITAVISISYYIAGLLEDTLTKLYYKTEATVSYGYGFYLIAFTAGISIVGTFCTLLLMHNSSEYNNDDRLIDNFEDSLNSFNNPPPPPPYNIPPPAYTP